MGPKNVWAKLSVWLVGVAWLLEGALGLEQYPLVQFKYRESQPIELKMGQSKEVSLLIMLDPNFLKHSSNSTELSLEIEVVAETPKFKILDVAPKEQTILKNISQKLDLKLEPTCIGRASIKPISLLIKKDGNLVARIILASRFRVPVRIIEDEGIYGNIFVISVSLLIVLSYISLGAQLDENNLAELIKKPKTILLGLIASVFVMPTMSYFIGKWILADQPLFRFGAFVFACGPAASASSLWTAMFESDKELSVALQVLSTLATLITMPGLLFTVGESIQLEQSSNGLLQVPYIKLLQGSCVIVVALFVGWRFIGRNEQARKIANSVFRPFNFFVLIYIILFSSVVYWYLYKLFDWLITLNALLTILSTCVISGLIGYIINLNLDQAIVVGISSIYKNSGIAFAVFLVALENPDLYMAFVPSLMQVILTSLSLYLAYGILKLITLFKRRDQPGPIQATKTIDDTLDHEDESQTTKKKADRSGSTSDKSINNDEFIVMNVNDYVDPPDSPTLNRDEANNLQVPAGDKFSQSATDVHPASPDRQVEKEAN